MADDLWGQLSAFAERLRIEGMLGWADELDGVTRYASTGSEALMGARWVLTRLISAEAETTASSREAARGLMVELTAALGRS
ncbi:hypothetical protein SK224_01205 [Microbacterium sp. BG28]|uniref:hypothetical protein n=1 Tax=Microbacterium sp. BG28 TaxID=3097356 RepID=UPI002A5ADF9F|nr:hypothetical protein [Microbacterium sp. BG28]MDY0827735.1 hypothetical protein [Microbacterium sp. BG28]